jgi:hypothetical protein
VRRDNEQAATGGHQPFGKPQQRVDADAIEVRRLGEDTTTAWRFDVSACSKALSNRLALSMSKSPMISMTTAPPLRRISNRTGSFMWATRPHAAS